MGSGVFVSYRKSSDGDIAGRIRDFLAGHFGEDQVFFDVDSIRGGSAWKDSIDDSLSRAGVVVLIIGPRWLEVLEQRAGTGETDYHLREITMALDQGVSVYPVRVNSAPAPDVAALPSELRDRLPSIQWREVHGDMFAESMRRVIGDIERIVQQGQAESATAPAAHQAVVGAGGEVRVGPQTGDADYHEIADAVAAVGPGCRVRIESGTYLKPVLLDKPVALLAQEGAQVVLDCDSAPSITSQATDCTIQGLQLKTSARTGGVGLEVTSGYLTVKSCLVSARWTDGSTGIRVSGAGTRVEIDECEIRNVATGVHATGDATARVTSTTIGPTAVHGVLIEERADPQFLGCFIRDPGGTGVLVTKGGLGTIGTCVIGTAATSSTIEISDGANPTIRGLRKSKGSPSSNQEGPERHGAARLLGRGGEAKNRVPWSVHVHSGGSGTIEHCELGLLHIERGGNPTMVGCAVERVQVEHEGLGTLVGCDIGQVVLTTGADPVIRGGSKIKPPRGAKVTVEVRDAARGTFEDCEIIGRVVRDGSADPAVSIVSGGDPTLRRCSIDNPDEGAVYVGDGGLGRVEACQLRTSLGAAALGGPALVIADGGSFSALGGTTIHGGVRIDAGGAGRLDDCDIEARSIGAAGVVIDAGGSCVMAGCKVHEVKTRGVVVAGTAQLTGCEISETGTTGLEVTAGATLSAESCTITGSGGSTTQKIGRWVSSRSEKAAGKVEQAMRAAPAIWVAEGGQAAFRGCSVAEAGEKPIVAPEDGVSFEDCTLDGQPYPGALPE